MKKKLIEVSVATLAILSLAAAASDGPYFPWPNWIGIMILAIIVICINALERNSGPTMYVFPDESTAHRFSRYRIQPRRSAR